jgi:hypothetical protein
MGCVFSIQDNESIERTHLLNPFYTDIQNDVISPGIQDDGRLKQHSLNRDNILNDLMSHSISDNDSNKSSSGNHKDFPDGHFILKYISDPYDLDDIHTIHMFGIDYPQEAYVIWCLKYNNTSLPLALKQQKKTNQLRFGYERDAITVYEDWKNNCF